MEVRKKKVSIRWHILVFLAPAFLIYTVVMIGPMVETLRLSFFQRDVVHQVSSFVGFDNYRTLLFNPNWWDGFVNALGNNFFFFIVHMLVQNPIGILLAALLSIPGLSGGRWYRTFIFMPTLLSFVVVGFVWRLILSPLWGVGKNVMATFGLADLFRPFLGIEETALTTLSLISVWQFIGIPMMLVYAALLSIPTSLTEAAACDGVVGVRQFFLIKLPLILPTVGIVSIMTFVGNFNAFDLVYTTQGALAGPNYSTDLLGTLLHRTFYGQQMRPGDPYMGSTVATFIFLIVLAGVSFYLFVIQRRIMRYEL